MKASALSGGAPEGFPRSNLKFSQRRQNRQPHALLRSAGDCLSPHPSTRHGQTTPTELDALASSCLPPPNSSPLTPMPIAPQFPPKERFFCHSMLIIISEPTPAVIRHEWLSHPIALGQFDESTRPREPRAKAPRCTYGGTNRQGNLPRCRFHWSGRSPHSRWVAIAPKGSQTTSYLSSIDQQPASKQFSSRKPLAKTCLNLPPDQQWGR